MRYTWIEVPKLKQQTLHVKYVTVTKISNNSSSACIPVRTSEYVLFYWSNRVMILSFNCCNICDSSSITENVFWLLHHETGQDRWHVYLALKFVCDSFLTLFLQVWKSTYDQKCHVYDSFSHVTLVIWNRDNCYLRFLEHKFTISIIRGMQ